MRVLLVDDHPLFRQALAATVYQIDATIVVEQFQMLEDVRRRLEEDADVALILLDLRLPDSQGIGGLLALKAHFPDVPVGIVSARDDAETVRTAMACGAAGFISKAVGTEELSAAIEALIGGEGWFVDSAGDDGQAGLTSGQMRIVEAVRRGLMNKQIAHELGLSEATVKYHLTGIFRKMGVLSRSQLLALSAE